jgi:hypothetical protein
MTGFTIPTVEQIKEMDTEQRAKLLQDMNSYEHFLDNQQRGINSIRDWMDSNPIAAKS